MSRRSDSVAPFLVMEVLERAKELERQGRRIIHLEVGEPDCATPEVVREAGVRAIRDGHTHYTHSLGRPELREAIAEWQTERFGVAVSPDEVVVTTGSSGAMVLVFAALLDPGDEALVPDPGYPCYSKFVQVLDAVPVPVGLSVDNGFQPRSEDLETLLTPRTRVLVLNSPSNPMGTVLDDETWQSLAAWAEGRVSVVSDEIYGGLAYGVEPRTVRRWSAGAAVVSGFSKLFAMTGWRLGYAIVPAPLVRSLQRLQQNLFISAPDFAQIAAVTALREASSEVEAMRRRYDQRRRFLLDRLPGIGLPVAGNPVGAFYLFLDVSGYTDNVYRFAFEILERAGVALTPGVDFGCRGEGYLRVCYAASMEDLEEGIERLSRFLGERARSGTRSSAGSGFQTR